VLDESHQLGWGVKVTRVEVPKDRAARDITDAMSRQMKAKQKSAPRG